MRYVKWRPDAIAQKSSASFFFYTSCIFLRGKRGKRDKSRPDAIAQKFGGAESLRYGAESLRYGANFALASGAERGKWRPDAIAQKFGGAESLRYGAEKFALRGKFCARERGRAQNGVLTPSRKKK